jgi:hypothetical protein
LYDFTSGKYLFLDGQITSNDSGLPGNTFTVGGSEGQDVHTVGALSGMLVADHHYVWYYSAYIQALPNADSGASASGSVRVAFTDLPDPSATFGGLLLLGALSARGVGRRRRAARS